MNKFTVTSDVTGPYTAYGHLERVIADATDKILAAPRNGLSTVLVSMSVDDATGVSVHRSYVDCPPVSPDCLKGRGEHAWGDPTVIPVTSDLATVHVVCHECGVRRDTQVITPSGGTGRTGAETTVIRYRVPVSQSLPGGVSGPVVRCEMSAVAACTTSAKSSPLTGKVTFFELTMQKWTATGKFK